MPKIPLRCPSCGYSPYDEERKRDVLVQGGLEGPSCYDEALDYFEVTGAEEGNVFCPRCSQEFNPRTRECLKP